MTHYSHRTDKLKELILETKRKQKLSAEGLAQSIGISRSTYTRLMTEHSSEWLTEAVKMCKAMKIPITTIRQNIE